MIPFQQFPVPLMNTYEITWEGSSALRREKRVRLGALFLPLLQTPSLALLLSPSTSRAVAGRGRMEEEEGGLEEGTAPSYPHPTAPQLAPNLPPQLPATAWWKRTSVFIGCWDRYT